MSRIVPTMVVALAALLATVGGAGATTPAPVEDPVPTVADPAPSPDPEPDPGTEPATPPDAGTGPEPSSGDGTDPAAECSPFVEFDPANFSNPTKIDNPLFPLKPGTRRVYMGVANRGGGLTQHRVTFTVTNVVKDIAGVQTVAVWDIDENEVGGRRRIVEEELAFFAQDDDGNVWNLGEYPEEFDTRGRFAGAPNTWIASVDEAVPGVHMPAAPAVGQDYLQGDAPEVEFLDCANVFEADLAGCVLELCFEGGLLTYERSPLDPAGGIQTKLHAPGIGIVEIGALDDPEGETLVLAHLIKIDQDEREDATKLTLRLDQRGYQFGGPYGRTERAFAAQGCGSAWWCHPGWPDWDDWNDWHHGGLPARPAAATTGKPKPLKAAGVRHARRLAARIKAARAHRGWR